MGLPKSEQTFRDPIDKDYAFRGLLWGPLFTLTTIPRSTGLYNCPLKEP